MSKLMLLAIIATLVACPAPQPAPAACRDAAAELPDASTSITVCAPYCSTDAECPAGRLCIGGCCARP